MKIDFVRAVEEHRLAIDSVFNQSGKILSVIEKIVEAVDQGAKVIWLGNGGSAADAQHMAAELMVRYVKDRGPIASISLTTDTSILTAHSNDYSFDTVFSRQIEGLAKSNDIVISLSTSGNSVNVVNAVKAARKKGCFTISMTGQQCSALSELSDICFRINSSETARVQEAHGFLSHLICEGLDSIYAD